MSVRISLFLSAALMTAGASISSAQHGAQADKLLQDIYKFNDCYSASDCRLIDINKCPYGCQILVNKRQASQITKRIQAMPSECNLTCSKKARRTKDQVECVARRCQFRSKRDRSKPTPEQIAVRKQIDSAQARVQLLRDVLKGRGLHAQRLETKLRSLNGRLKRGEAPTERDYVVLTQLETQYKVLGLAGAKQKKKK